MKRMQILLCAGLCLFLTACAENDTTKETDGHVQVTGEQDAGDSADAQNAEEAGGSADAENAYEAGDGADVQSAEETDVMVSEPEPVDEAGLLYEMTEPTEILVENPSQEYYLTEAVASQEERWLSLELLTEEANEIVDTEEWFRQNELPAFDTFHMEDDIYRYEIVGDNYASGYLVSIYRKENAMFLQRLDFSDYRYTDNIKPGDEAFVEQRVWWAQSVDDVLYVAVSHNTYTESCPHTGYLVAIDLNDAHVIWKSAPCMTNGSTFEIIDDTIVCGYGMTAEPDHLNLVSRLDGTLLEQIPVKSMVNYIYQKDDTLYVRTYDTNYTFRILRDAE